MTAEVQAQETQVAEEPMKVAEKTETQVDDPKSKTVEKCSSYKEESNHPSDLKEHERRALNDLKAKLEEAILGNNLFAKQEKEKEHPPQKGEEKRKDKAEEEGGKAVKEEAQQVEGQEKEKADKSEGEEGEKKPNVGTEEKGQVVDTDISLWGVPLLPSKGCEGIDAVLLKFLRAREFKVNEAFEMLKKTLQWRRDFNIDSILEEDLGTDLSSMAYMSGVDRERHPICYNIFGVLDSDELYQKTFGTEEKRGQFLRWRLQLMEKGIQKLDLKPGGVNSLLQINDLKNSPGPSKKELKAATKQAVDLLQDNYPEFVARNIFINVPFWYYAFHALLSPFLTQRTKSKFVLARPAKVTETLLKYIQIEEIPIQYGGLKRDNDFEFSEEDGGVSEFFVKSGSTQAIEIPMPEVQKY